ncbi:MAG: biopolymer transporter ExbD [Verrucomicrobiae bacterium]|nr:biopolymer transporter ExbD [Verrucomicrobiae bacterium]
MPRRLKASEKVFGPEDPEFQIAPMVDVLLVILMFFVAITSAETLKGRPNELGNLELPVAKDSAQRKTTAGELVVNADWVNGAGMLEVAEISTSAFADPDKIRPLLRSSLQADPNYRVVIRADRRMEYGFIRQIMKICSEEGVLNISFAVVDKERPR